MAVPSLNNEEYWKKYFRLYVYKRKWTQVYEPKQAKEF